MRRCAGRTPARSARWRDARRERAARGETRARGARPRARALERRAGRVRHVASHDLSEPLRTITGYLQLRRRFGNELSVDADEYVPAAIASADRRAMIDDVLAYCERAPERPPSWSTWSRRRGGRVGHRRAAAGDRVGRAADRPGEERQLVQLMQNLRLPPRPSWSPHRGARQPGRYAPAWSGIMAEDNRIDHPPRRTHLRDVPAPARTRELPWHGHRPRHRPQGRRAPRRPHLGQGADGGTRRRSRCPQAVDSAARARMPAYRGCRACRAIGTVAEPRADSVGADPAPRDVPRRVRGSRSAA